ncbi:MAG: hypothetical protein ABEJ02_01585 [Candidatus Paceibacteria bacterium]
MPENNFEKSAKERTEANNSNLRKYLPYILAGTGALTGLTGMDSAIEYLEASKHISDNAETIYKSIAGVATGTLGSIIGYNLKKSNDFYEIFM